eukprot:1179593-Prorocentrum_minimum.AAC.2
MAETYREGLHAWVGTAHSSSTNACSPLPKLCPRASCRRLRRFALHASSAELERGHGRDGERESDGRAQRAKSQPRRGSSLQGVVLRSEGLSKRRIREEESTQKSLATALETYETRMLGGGAADISDYTAAIEACRQGGDGKSALRVFREMQAAGECIDADTYNITLDALARGGELETALDLMDEMVTESINADVHTYNTIITGYAQGRNVSSERALQKDKLRTTHAYNDARPTILANRSERYPPS